MTGVDIDQSRVGECSSGIDRWLEVDISHLRVSTGLTFSTDRAVLDDGKVFIVTTPPPIAMLTHPDLAPLLSATRTVGGALGTGEDGTSESTEYPEATEACMRLLADAIGLHDTEHPGVGYSQKRISPAGEEHRSRTIIEVMCVHNLEAGRSMLNSCGGDTA